MTGKEAPVSIETLRALLKSLGCPAKSNDDVRDSLAALDVGIHFARAGSRFVTARVGQPISIPRVGLTEALEISYEGEEKRVVCTVENFGEVGRLPPFDRPGYHTVHLEAGDLTVATAPKRCLSILDRNRGHPGWGIAAQIYSLGSEVECGIGDFGGLAALAVTSARQGADLLAVSPLHAVLGIPERFNSPYSASSRLFLDPIYADPTLSLPASMVQELSGVSQQLRTNCVDWPTARAAKIAFLQSVYASLLRSDCSPRVEFAAFQASAARALKDHALFEAIRAHLPLHWDWRQWPAGLSNPASQDAQAFARDNQEAISFQIFLQWITRRSSTAVQAVAKHAGMSIGLIADVAAGIDPAGSDAWGRQEVVLRGATLGAPPDLFTPAGQDWRLTSFSPNGLVASAFAPFIETLRACLDHVGGVRIDHIMGAQRLWLIPEGMDPTKGAYVNFPAEALFRLIALESWKRRAIVIGEDLGTLPPGFQEYVAEQGIAGMRLLRIERDRHSWKPPSQWSRHAVAMTATHDIVATAGWWKGVDLLESNERQLKEQDRERDRGLLWDAFCDASVAEGEPPRTDDAEQVVDAALAFVAKTPCEIKLVTLEDVLATEIQPNVPGTTFEKPNWRHRFAQSAEMLLSHPKVVERLAKLGLPRVST